MSKTIVVETPGGPEAMKVVERTVGEPGPWESRMWQSAAGVNFADVYFRTGLYKAPPPFTPGMEGAGVIEAVRTGVTDLRVGQRVAYPWSIGAYAEVLLSGADKGGALPDAFGDEQAAAMMLKGLTAQYLLRQTLPLAAGDTILFHAAAGGVGHLVCQWARHLGIQVIGTAGGPEKCALVRAAGAAHAIDYKSEDFVARTSDLTSGKGVEAVYDSVGKDTFMRSLDCLRPFGMLVALGQSSGAVAPFDVLALSTKGSLYLTRPSLATYVAERDRWRAMAAELFAVVASGAVKIDIGQRYPLAEAGRAHQELEARRTTGASVLLT